MSHNTYLIELKSVNPRIIIFLFIFTYDSIVLTLTQNTFLTGTQGFLQATKEKIFVTQRVGDILFDGYEVS